MSDRQSTGPKRIPIDLLVNDPYMVRSMDVASDALKNFDDNILKSVDRGKKKYSGDFFIVVLIKIESLTRRIRLLYTPIPGCPTPNYDQIVFKYDHTLDKVEELWVIPNKYACETYRENIAEIDKQEHKLRDYIIDFYNGNLSRKADQLNNKKTIIANH